MHDTTSVSFRQLSVEVDKWVWPRRIVIFTATSDQPCTTRYASPFAYAICMQAKVFAVQGHSYCITGVATNNYSMNFNYLAARGGGNWPPIPSPWIRHWSTRFSQLRVLRVHKQTKSRQNFCCTRTSRRCACASDFTRRDEVQSMDCLAQTVDSGRSTLCARQSMDCSRSGCW